MAAGISERRRAVVSTQAVVSFASGIPRRKEAVRKAHSFPEGISDDVLIASVSGYDVLTQLGLRLAVGGKAFAQGLPKTFTMHGERMTTSRAGRTRWSCTICWRGMGWTRGCSIQGHGSPLHQMEEPIATMTGEFFKEAFVK
jgi:hypothetical protein